MCKDVMAKVVSTCLHILSVSCTAGASDPLTSDQKCVFSSVLFLANLEFQHQYQTSFLLMILD